MKCPVCLTSSTVNKDYLHAICVGLKQIPYLTLISGAPRMCSWPKWPHVCCHLRCGGNISGERRVCPPLFWRGRYRNVLNLERQTPLLWHRCDKATFLIVSPRRELLPQLRRPCGHWATSLPLNQRSRVRSCGLLSGRCVRCRGWNTRRNIGHKSRCVFPDPVFVFLTMEFAHLETNNVQIYITILPANVTRTNYLIIQGFVLFFQLNY